MRTRLLALLLIVSALGCVQQAQNENFSSLVQLLGQDQSFSSYSASFEDAYGGHGGSMTCIYNYSVAGGMTQYSNYTCFAYTAGQDSIPTTYDANGTSVPTDQDIRDDVKHAISNLTDEAVNSVEKTSTGNATCFNIQTDSGDYNILCFIGSDLVYYKDAGCCWYAKTWRIPDMFSENL